MFTIGVSSLRAVQMSREGVVWMVVIWIQLTESHPNEYQCEGCGMDDGTAH